MVNRFAENVIVYAAWGLLLAFLFFLATALMTGCTYDSLIEVNIYGGGEKTRLDVLTPPDTEPEVILETDDGTPEGP